MFTQAASFLSTSMRAACSASSLLGYVEYTKQNSFVASTMGSPSFTQRDVIGLGSNPFQPRADGRIIRQIESAIRGHMRVGVERNVGDGVSAACEPILFFEMPLHDRKRRVAFGVPLG